MFCMCAVAWSSLWIWQRMLANLFQFWLHPIKAFSILDRWRTRSETRAIRAIIARWHRALIRAYCRCRFHCACRCLLFHKPLLAIFSVKIIALVYVLVVLSIPPKRSRTNTKPQIKLYFYDCFNDFVKIADKTL